MPEFSQHSKNILYTCHDKIQLVMLEAIKAGPDFSIVSGRREQAEQDHLYNTGASKLKFPFSKHNESPSHAIDIAPFPIDWTDEKRFHVLAGWILAIGHKNHVELKWGGDWDRDWSYKDQTFHDLGHFELL